MSESDKYKRLLEELRGIRLRIDAELGEETHYYPGDSVDSINACTGGSVPTEPCPICGSCWSWSHKHMAFFCDGDRIGKPHIATHPDESAPPVLEGDSPVPQGTDIISLEGEDEIPLLCANCMYWDPLAPDGPIGRCMLNPPRSKLEGPNVIQEWTITKDRDWCAQHSGFTTLEEETE